MSRKLGFWQARILADGIIVIGHLLLGYDSWSMGKAAEAGFFATLHKLTGIVVNTDLGPEPRASFTLDRLEKCLEIVQVAMVTSDDEEDEWPLSFVSSGFGNMNWLQKVYHPFKAFTAAYRRPMALAGARVSTQSDMSKMILPKSDNESKAEGARNFRKDNAMIDTMLQYLKRVKETYGENTWESTVPFSDRKGTH